MDSAVIVNGEPRRLWSAHVNIDGIWRDADLDSKVSDRWRLNIRNELFEKDIVGFRMMYRKIDHIFSEDIPYLKHNDKLPVKFNVTGASSQMDMIQKGVLYFYTTEDVKIRMEEGILLYGGELYAVLISGETVLVSTSKNTSSVEDIRFNPGNGIEEAWITSRVKNLRIDIQGYTKRDQTGNYWGWNTFFDNVEEIFDVNEPTPRDIHRNRVILPIEKRVSTYDAFSLIGIARNVSQVANNMLNSHGTISHTISEVLVNGVNKPFTVEIIN